MREVFADTFYFLALNNPADAAHQRALVYSSNTSTVMITTAWVLAEVGNALSGSQDRRRFVELLRLLETTPTTQVVPANQEDFDQGMKLYRERTDKEWSVTDCISFVVMNERKIAKALTGDRHFEQAGFRALLR